MLQYDYLSRSLPSSVSFHVIAYYVVPVIVVAAFARGCLPLIAKSPPARYGSEIVQQKREIEQGITAPPVLSVRLSIVTMGGRSSRYWVECRVGLVNWYNTGCYCAAAIVQLLVSWPYGFVRAMKTLRHF